MNLQLQQKFLNLFNDLLQGNSSTESEAFFESFYHSSNIVQSELSQGDEIDRMNAQKEAQLSLRLNSRNLLFLKKVEKAKDRILDGSFGICEECGSPIHAQRLVARPTATLCIHCQEEKEREERNNIHHRRDFSFYKAPETEDKGVIRLNPKYSEVKDIGFDSVLDA